MNLDQQIEDFEQRLEVDAKNVDANLPWAMFLIGELDPTGKTADEILANKDQRERYYLAVGRLGILVGKRSGGVEDLVNPGAVRVTVTKNTPS